MSVQDEITRIQNGKEDLLNAIAEYGVEVSSSTPIEETGDKVRQIGEKFYTKTESDNKYATKSSTENMNKEAYLEWGGRDIEGILSPIDVACDLGESANKFAFLLGLYYLCTRFS